VISIPSFNRSPWIQHAAGRENAVGVTRIDEVGCLAPTLSSWRLTGLSTRSSDVMLRMDSWPFGGTKREPLIAASERNAREAKFLHIADPFTVSIEPAR